MQESGTVETEQDVTLKRIKGVRGPNSYNLFCADFFKTGECKGLTYQEKNKRASEKWKEQNDSQRKKFVDSAKVYKELNVKVSELTDDQRKKLINRHRKKLLEEILVLEDLGWQTASIHLDVGGEVYNLGSKGGTAFLAINPDISIKFCEYFGGNNQHFTIAHDQDLFNKKYSDACGKPCKVPYLKGGFEVHGLPEGIQFKKPYSYGRSQLKQIMLHADKIHFTITSNSLPATSALPPAASTSPPTTPSLPLTTPTLPPSTYTLPPATSTFQPATSTLPPATSTLPPATSTLPPATFILPSALTDTNTGPALTSTESNFASTADIKHVLAKMAGADAMQRALDGGKIEEDEVKVVDLCLSAAEN